MGLPQLALERDGGGAAERIYLYGHDRIAMQARCDQRQHHGHEHDPDHKHEEYVARWL